MYVLFAVLVSLATYAVLLVALRLVHRAPGRPNRLALASLLVLVLALVVFNLTSRAIGVDLGPGRPVSYGIPDDYLARGVLGALALLPYALACLAPVVAQALLARR